ncbi:asparaginyl-tRNA synthetase [Phlyctema vagabunda]|uniref:asparagine--tRNA ligase n=1 Tax=Phlyctema vagabunda TaxID=108571 RepID=A0ABR4P8Q8_9HELO
MGVDVLGPSDPADFPLQKKYMSPEYLRTLPHLRSRLPLNTSVLRLRSQCITQLTQFFAERDFTQTHPPVITSSDCEGAGEVFTVTARDDKKLSGAKDDDGSFFRTSKYLTVSSQLHLEALAQSVGNVWTLSPTFRAEKSDTARHLSEFYMLEAEMTFVDDMGSVMDLIEEMLKYMTNGLYQTRVVQEIMTTKRASPDGSGNTSDLSPELERRWQGMMTGPWPRITYAEAISILQSSDEKFEHAPVWGSGLQAEHERYIAHIVGQGHPVFVTKYPKSIKPFYMLPTNSDESTVDCFDLLVPEVCEIVGGSMREHREDQLVDAMRANGLLRSEAGSPEEMFGSLKWYVDLRKWGTVPHGGFGLGFDRLLLYLSGLQNIREAVTFPRWVGRCEC